MSYLPSQAATIAPQQSPRYASVLYTATMGLIVVATVLLNLYLYSPEMQSRRVRPQTVAQRQPVDLLKSTGTFFGATLDWSAGDLPASFAKRIARESAVYQFFIEVTDRLVKSQELKFIAEAVAQTPKSWLSLTVMPIKGFAVLNSGTFDQIAETVGAINDLGVPVMLRFGHEMNGNWYPWGQQPTAYVRAYVALAQRVRKRTRNTFFVWAPNIATNYPWASSNPNESPYSAKPTNVEDWKLLDTNQDNKLSDLDDPYLPYYPGDEWVDFVGLSLFYFGDKDKAKNVDPSPDYFELQFSATGPGSKFSIYRDVCEKRNKQLIISETSAAFYEKLADSTIEREVSVKRLWLSQIGNSIKSGKYPLLRLLLWFDITKDEPNSAGGMVPVDFDISTKTQVQKVAESELFKHLQFVDSKQGSFLKN